MKQKTFNLEELNKLFEESELYSLDYLEDTLVRPMTTMLTNDFIGLTEEQEDKLRYIDSLMVATKRLEYAYDLSANYISFETKVHDTILWETYTMTRDALLKELGYVWFDGKLTYIENVMQKDVK